MGALFFRLIDFIREYSRLSGYYFGSHRSPYVFVRLDVILVVQSATVGQQRFELQRIYVVDMDVNCAGNLLLSHKCKPLCASHAEAPQVTTVSDRGVTDYHALPWSVLEPTTCSGWTLSVWRAPLGRRAVLCVDRAQSTAGEGLRGHNRLSTRLPLSRIRHAARASARSYFMTFETDS
jgi:hypothetical protein